MLDAFVCDYVRTPIGRYGATLSTKRADDMAAVPLAALEAQKRRGGLGGGGTRAAQGSPGARHHVHGRGAGDRGRTGGGVTGRIDIVDARRTERRWA